MESKLMTRLALVLAVVLSMVTLARPACAQAADGEQAGDAEAEAARQQCFDAHRDAQELKRQSKFVEARESLLICSSAQCPGVIIEDCGTWMTDLETLTPSMVFEVYVDGEDAPDAKIFVDGDLVDDKVGGIQVNPGRHQVRATLPPHQPITQTVTLPAGRRMKLVRFDFKSASALPPIMNEKAAARPTPVAVYPLLGVGVAGLAAFGVFAVLGRNEQRHNEDRCAPNCTDDQLSKMKTMYLVGDISAAVGAAALVSAGIVYLARPHKETKVPVALSIDPFQGRFGLVASGRF